MRNIASQIEARIASEDVATKIEGYRMWKQVAGSVEKYLPRRV